MVQWFLLVRELCNAIHNDVVGGGNTIRVDPHWIVEHDGTLEVPRAFPIGDCLAPLQIHASDVTLSMKRVWLGMGRDPLVRRVMSWFGNIVDDDGCVLQGVDANCVP